MGLHEELLGTRGPNGLPLRRDGDSWDQMLSISAYRGMTTSGPMAQWWERNCWKPIFSKQVGVTCAEPEPAPSGYLQPAKRARLEEVRDIPPLPPAADAERARDAERVRDRQQNLGKPC